MTDKRAAWQLVASATLLPPTDTGRQRVRAQLQLAQGSWEQVIKTADRGFVTPAFWLGLRRLELDGEIPDDARRYLSAVHSMNVERNAGITEQLQEISDRVAAEGGRCVALKGGAMLSNGALTDVGERMLTDIDIMLDDEILPSAPQILSSLGYRIVGESKDRGRKHHHLQPMFKNGTFAIVEIHRRPLSFLAEDFLPVADVWAKATPSPNTGNCCLCPAPDHMIELSFLHSEIVDRNLKRLKVNLRLLQDILGIENSFSSQIGWREIDRRLSRHNRGRTWTTVRALLARFGDFDPMAEPGKEAQPIAHHAMLMAARNWDWLELLATRIDRLSRASIEQRMGPQRGWLDYTRARLRTVGSAVAKRTSGGDVNE